MSQSSSIIKFLMSYRYLALFPLACLEGPIVALAVGFLVHLGYFMFIPAYFVMILGDFVPDSLYYAIGRFGNKEKLVLKYDTKSKLISRNFGYLERVWHKHTLKTMFVSKLAYAFSIPLLVTAGLVRLPYRKFVWQALIVTLFQYGVLMTVGYLLGKSYEVAVPYVKGVAIIIAVIAIVFVAGYFMLQKYIKNKVVEEIEK